MCLCEEEEQTVENLIFKCKKLRNQREEIIRQIKKMVAIGLQRKKHSLKIKIFLKFVMCLEYSEVKWLLIKT